MTDEGTLQELRKHLQEIIDWTVEGLEAAFGFTSSHGAKKIDIPDGDAYYIIWARRVAPWWTFRKIWLGQNRILYVKTGRGEFTPYHVEEVMPQEIGDVASRLWRLRLGG